MGHFIFLPVTWVGHAFFCKIISVGQIERAFLKINIMNFSSPSPPNPPPPTPPPLPRPDQSLRPFQLGYLAVDSLKNIIRKLKNGSLPFHIFPNSTGTTQCKQLYMYIYISSAKTKQSYAMSTTKCVGKPEIICYLARSLIEQTMSGLVITGLQGTPSYKFGSVRSSTQYPGTFTYGHC